MHIVNTFVQDRRLALVPVTIFEESMNQALYKLARPPSRKHTGTRLREARQFPTIAPVFHHWMSIVRGLPHFSQGENIERIVWSSMHPQGAPLIPIKETAVRRTFKVKLMRQDSVMAFAALDLYQPQFAVRATRLLVKPASADCEARARALCMLAGLLTVKMFELIGKAKNKLLKFYNPDLAVTEEEPKKTLGDELAESFIQLQSEVGAKQPEVSFAGNKTQKSGGVMALMDKLIKELETDNQEAELRCDNLEKSSKYNAL